MSRPVDQKQPIIQLKELHKHYGSLEVLKSVSLEVMPGQTVVLLGHSGCGKTTVLRCIHALESIDSGEILVNGTQLYPLPSKPINLNRYRSRIGMIFQQFNLFPHLSVLENLILAPMKVLHIPKEQAVQTAEQLLERINLLDKKYAYPDQLSGGQQQRVAIARSLAMSPDVMLVDEPTSALDPQMTQEVLAVLHDLAQQGMTLLIVTHHIGFAERVADRIVFMHEGEIIEDGPPSQILHTPQHPSTRRFLKDLLV